MGQNKHTDNKKNTTSTYLSSPETVNILKNHLIDYESFLELIKYERFRSDRLGDVFSLVIIDGKDKELNLLEIGMIKNITLPQLRSTDYMGWYGRNTIALLLPLADYTESKTLMDRIKVQILKMGIVIEATCHSYPENWFTRKKIQGDLYYTPWSSEYIENEVNLKISSKIPRWKRIGDILFSSFFLLMFSPLMLIVSLYIKLVSPGPIFFVQNRVGHRGKTFRFYKFRSMHFSNNQDLHGKYSHFFIKDGNIPMVKLDTHDSRIIKGGGFLRSSCIDELPQLLNVLKGDMSLVGPRPCIPYEAEEYLRWHTQRFDTVPGITGLWQVSGKNDLSFKEMVRLDIIYSKNISPINDIIIMLKTIPTIFKLLLKYIHPNTNNVWSFEEKNNQSKPSAVDPKPIK